MKRYVRSDSDITSSFQPVIDEIRKLINSEKYGEVMVSDFYGRGNRWQKLPLTWLNKGKTCWVLKCGFPDESNGFHQDDHESEFQELIHDVEQIVKSSDISEQVQLIQDTGNVLNTEGKILRIRFNFK